MNKRAIIILSAIFLLIVGTLAFLLFTRQEEDATDQNNNTNNQQANNTNNSGQNQTTPPPTPAPTPITPPPPVSLPSGPQKLLSDEIISPILFYKGDGISYFNSQGQLFQVDLRITGNSASVSNKKRIELPTKVGISKILWPSTGNNFIAVQSSGVKHTWSFYDGTRQFYVDLPSQIGSLDWLPDASKIIYVWQGQNGNNSLNISNPDGSNYAKLANMYYPDSEISVSPDGKNILFYRTQNLTEKNPITLVTADGKVFKTAIKDGFNLGVLWAPDSKRFVFTKRDALTQNFSLWLGNILLDDPKNLNLNAPVDKIVWEPSGKFIYVSATVPGAGQTKESIYKVNTETLEKTEIVSGTSFNPRDMFLSLNSEVLFFRSANDGGLYSVPLQNSTASTNNPSNQQNTITLPLGTVP